MRFPSRVDLSVSPRSAGLTAFEALLKTCSVGSLEDGSDFFFLASARSFVEALLSFLIWRASLVVPPPWAFFFIRSRRHGAVGLYGLTSRLSFLFHSASSLPSHLILEVPLSYALLKLVLPLLCYLFAARGDLTAKVFLPEAHPPFF